MGGTREGGHVFGTVPLPNCPFFWFQVMDFTKENVASYIAMVGVLSVLAQVSAPGMGD